MFYVLQHIFVCLLAAALLGGLIAWLLRGFGFGKKLAAAEEEWSGKLGLLEADNGKLSAQWKEAEGSLSAWKQKFASLEGDHNRLQADFSGVSARLPVLETAIAGWTAKAAAWDSDRGKLQTDLRACADARSALEVQLAEWNTRAKAWDTERATLRANLHKAVSDDAADDAAYEKTITALRAEVSGLQLKLKHAEIAANEWQTKYLALEGQHKNVVAERDRALAGYKQAVADDASDDAAYEKTIAVLRAENAALQTQFQAATVKLDQAAGDQKTIAALQADLAAMTAQYNKAVAEDRSEDANYERVIAQLRGELASLKQAAKQAADDDTIEDANFRNTIAGLRAEVEGLQAKLRREQEADRADDAAYEAKLAAAQARIAELEAKAAAPLAMAAAAGASATSVGAVTTTVVDDGRLAALSGRLQSFVLRTQREGWGDIERIEGIGPVYGQKLRSIGIAWVKDLLEEGGAAGGRQRIAEESGIKRELILKWVNAADLLRIPGVTPDWAELLEASGVDTVKELRGRVPENLRKKLAETNPVGNYARTVPDLETVRGWVESAQKMEPKVTH